jgi:hypothetical protein
MNSTASHGRMRLLMCVALLLSSGAALSQQGAGPMGPRRGRDGGPLLRNPPDEKEVLDWARERMPNLHKLHEAQNQGRRPFFNVARMRYRGQKQIENDPDGLERMLKNIRLEDQAFGYILELENAKPEDKPAIREKIRTTFRSVYEEYLAQRAERIERLKDRLEDEERRLEEERAQTDQRVEQQLARFGVGPEPTTRESAEPEPAENTMAAPRRVP